jgi:hypothetical protein
MKSNLQIQCNAHQNTNDILHRNRKTTLKFKEKYKKPRTVKAILSKKSNAGGIRISNFKTYYRIIIILTPW